MSKNPLISIIIPVFNSEKYLNETLRSVLNQDYLQREVMVIDGNSTDGTENICKNFSGINFHKQKGEGISDALNFGIEKSKGEFICFISSDDLWTHNKLSTQCKFMIENPEIQYSVTRAKFILDPNSKKPANFREEFLEKDTVQNILETLMARKSLFEKIGDFDTEFSAGMEIDWFARAIDKNIPMAVIDKTLTHKRVHSESITQNTTKILNQSIRAMYNSIKRKKSQKKNSNNKK